MKNYFARHVHDLHVIVAARTVVIEVLLPDVSVGERYMNVCKAVLSGYCTMRA